VHALSRCCSWRRYAPRQSIIEYGDEPNNVFFVTQGKVRATYYSLSDREVTFRDLNCGELFGELSAIDGQPRSASVFALSDSLIAVMASPVFLNVLRQHEQVAVATLRRLVRLVRELSERVIEFSTLAVRDRIHAELLRLAYASVPAGKIAVIYPVPKHADIANRVSTHREAVSRELNNLARSGLIEKRAGTLVIQDIAALTRMVHEALPN
jgi:CRP/FNR family transcriptional regulator, cyclic AMP receptor protein